jgi:hypothetical protein
MLAFLAYAGTGPAAASFRVDRRNGVLSILLGV